MYENIEDSAASGDRVGRVRRGPVATAGAGMFRDAASAHPPAVGLLAALRLSRWVLLASVLVGCGSNEPSLGNVQTPGGAGGTTSGLCAANEFRCVGDHLEACEPSGSGFHAVATCDPGLCDAAEGQCDNCEAGVGVCDAGGRSYSACDPTGQTKATFACEESHPFCTLSGDAPKCVECQAPRDCPASALDCLVAACSSEGGCGFQARAEGTACGKPGEGGKCDSAGQCTYCTPGEARCAELVPEVCDVHGRWEAGRACTGGDPVCSGGACVECVGEADCPRSSNECLFVACSGNACAYSPKSPSVPCLAGTGHCDGAGQCNLCAPGTLTCNGNKPMRCGSDGRYSEGEPCAGNTAVCAPATATCVQCSSRSDCAPPADECLTVNCIENACAYAPKAKDTLCQSGAGTCNGAGQCNLCEPGTRKCEGNVPFVCESTGHYVAEPACVGPTPICGGPSTKCVACESASHCAAQGECWQSECEANTCVASKRAEGTPCLGGKGSCDQASGTCLCTPGARRCDAANTPNTCDDNREWVTGAQCRSPTPYCESTTATCASCVADSQCPEPSNPCMARSCTAGSCGEVPRAGQCVLGVDTGSCNAGNCRVCAPGTKRCSASYPARPQTCNANWHWEDGSACAVRQFCQSGGCYYY